MGLHTTRAWTWLTGLMAIGVMGMALPACGESSADARPYHPSGIAEYGPTGADGTMAGGPTDPRFAPEPAVPNNDRYEPVGTNPFVTVAHDPFSTFAADVDTASYDIFRRDVGEHGDLPAPASVRLEEYVNYFDYAYPVPKHDAETPFTIELEAAAHPMGRDRTLLRVGIQAKARPPQEQQSANIIFLVDTSGSMASEDKIPLVKRLLSETLDAFGEQDTVSIVAYASNAGVRLPPTNVADSDTIRDAIEGLVAEGSTAGASGIHLAYEQAELGFIEGGINHVIMCTDGDFNVGIRDPDELVALIEEKRESGVTLTALGFGRGNLNDAMMERVSNAGNGIYSVITNEAHAVRYAREEILQTAHHVAKDMKIQVEFNPAHVVAYRLLGYENRAIADMDFRDDAVDAGEVGAGHRVTALYELVLHGDAMPDLSEAPAIEDGDPIEGDREIGPEQLVLVKVRYKDVLAAPDTRAREVASALRPDDVLGDSEMADEDFLFASAIAAFAEILKQSPYANEEDLDVIEGIVRAQAERDADRAELVTLFDDTRVLLDR